MAQKTFKEIEELLRDDHKIKLAGIDVDGVLRGKIMAKSKFLSSIKSDGFGFCSVVFGWDIHDATYSPELNISNINNGYRDIIARIDLDTFRRIPWESNIPFFLITFFDPDKNEPLYACPRATLRKSVQRLEEQGMSPYAGVEYEYFNFKETPESLAEKNFHNLQVATPGMHGYSLLRPTINQDYFHSIFDEGAKFGIEIESHHTETGPGVLETALAYTNALRMADNATLFKLLTKSLGLRHSILPTFMAKPHNNLPGCSGHIHLSLRSPEGTNLFAVKDEEVEKGRSDAKWEDTKRVSQVCEWFVAGVLDGLEDIMPCLVPTVNGYKRLVENFWAPVYVSYAYENRVASIRIISPPVVPPSSTRIEIRTPGADMSPHLSMAALLALGSRGVQNKIELNLSPLVTGSSSGDQLSTMKRLPKTLKEATDKMKRPESKARLVLGDQFVDHFAATREQEWQKFAQHVTDWELARYMELA